jgi:hypothetical protein
VEVDPSPLIGRFSEAWLLRYDGKQTVSTFLNNIWFKLTKEIPLPPHSYASAWALRDTGTGEELFSEGRDNGPVGQPKDQRPIAEAGIRPGMHMEAIRPGRHPRP